MTNSIICLYQMLKQTQYWVTYCRLDFSLSWSSFLDTVSTSPSDRPRDSRPEVPADILLVCNTKSSKVTILVLTYTDKVTNQRLTHSERLHSTCKMIRARHTERLWAQYQDITYSLPLTIWHPVDLARRGLQCFLKLYMVFSKLVERKCIIM